jgi:Nucleotide modification associated domain 3
MRAVRLVGNRIYRAIALNFNGQIFAGRAFVEWLIKGHMIEIDGWSPSPLVDGRPISLPIPTRMPTPTRFGDLSDDVAQLVSDLTRGRITAVRPCHLDPDLDAKSLVRHPGWRGALGQVSAAQSHLSNNDIDSGRSARTHAVRLARLTAVRLDARQTVTDNNALKKNVFGAIQMREYAAVDEPPDVPHVRRPVGSSD